MKRGEWVGWLFCGLMGFAVAALGVSPCGPGDGGTPNVLLPKTLNPGVKILKTDGGIQDFVLWERSGKLAYRDAHNRLQTYSLADGRNQLLSAWAPELAHVLDDNNRFLLAATAPWFFDTLSHQWSVYSGPNTGLKPLFFGNGTFYSARVVMTEEDQSQVEVYGSRPGMNGSALLCPAITLARDIDGFFGIAEGSRFPNLYFYFQEASERGYNLVVSRLNVQTCQPEITRTYPYVFYGPIQTMHVFDELGSFLIKVDHPTMNLLWSSQSYGSCRYYNIDNLAPFVLSDRQPVIATFAPGMGLKLVNLNDGTRGTLLQDWKVRDVGPENIWMNESGSKVYVAPRIDGSKDRLLMELNLPNRRD